MDTELSTGDAQVTVETVEVTATKPAHHKRGYWVEFLRGLTEAGTDLTFPTREELMRVRATIVTGANRLGIKVKTKSARDSVVLNVRLNTDTEVTA